MAKPDFVIDCENEKRFINESCKAYCNICPEKYNKVTGANRCDVYFRGSMDMTFSDSMKRDRQLMLECTIEDKMAQGGIRKMARRVTMQELKELYEVYE